MPSIRLLALLGYVLTFRTEVTGITGHCLNVKTSLSSVKKKRYVAFPDGSAASITIDLAKTFQTHVPSGWYVTMDLDVIFPLPDSKFTIEHSRRKHHRQKRDLWKRIEEAVGVYNINGRACILRSICEAKVHLAPKGKSLVHDVLRAVFTVPSFEKEFEEEMRESFGDDMLDANICDRIHECPLSLLHFILDLNRPRSI